MPWLDQIVEATPSALVVVDRDRMIRFANRATETTFGYARLTRAEG